MRKIAVCGKGGSGKSVVVRLLADAVRRRGWRAVIIDSDESNTGLHRMLGFEKQPEPLIGLLGGSRRLEEKLEEAVKNGIPEEKVDLMPEDLPMSMIPAAYLHEKDGIRLLVVGKILMALQGCACPIGIVSRSFLKRLQLEPDEIAIVDMEAGVEHFGRGVETSIDCVLAVVEPALDSMDVAEKIHEMSLQIDISDVWAVLNKITSPEIEKILRDRLESKQIHVIGAIKQNEEIFLSSFEGRPINSGVAAGDIDPVLEFLFP